MTRKYRLTIQKAVVEPGFGFTIIYDFRERLHTVDVTAGSLDELAATARAEAVGWMADNYDPERPDCAVSADVADGKRSPNGFKARFSGPILIERSEVAA